MQVDIVYVVLCLQCLMKVKAQFLLQSGKRREAGGIKRMQEDEGGGVGGRGGVSWVLITVYEACVIIILPGILTMLLLPWQHSNDRHIMGSFFSNFQLFFIVSYVRVWVLINDNPILASRMQPKRMIIMMILWWLLTGVLECCNPKTHLSHFQRWTTGNFQRIRTRQSPFLSLTRTYTHTISSDLLLEYTFSSVPLNWSLDQDLVSLWIIWTVTYSINTWAPSDTILDQAFPCQLPSTSNLDICVLTYSSSR